MLEVAVCRRDPDLQHDLMTLHRILRERRDAIVRRYVGELRAQGMPPAETSRTNLTDHIPSFLDDVVRELGADADDAAHVPGERSHINTTARQHGVQRWELGFDLGVLVREYGVLRRCILMEAKDAGIGVSIDEFDRLADCLNVGVAEAVTAFVAERSAERALQTERVEFLAEAGRLLGSSLDLQATLTRLTRLVVPRLADWCAVHLTEVPELDEIPVAHVDPARAPLVRELFAAPAWTTDLPAGYPRVIETGQKEHVTGALRETLSGAGADVAVLSKLAALEATGWLVVPLRVQRATFGAITFGFSAGAAREHDSVDVLLAEDLVARAAVAIENASLFALANRERARVEAATRAKDEFVGMISHELRTPLNAILGWTRLIRGGAIPPEKQPHAMEVIERNAEAQRQLVGDLLDVSKIISGTVRISPAQMDLGDVVDIALEGVRPAAEAKRVTLDLDHRVERGTAVMRGDSERLQQVAWQLLTNAVKFTPKGGRVHVTVGRAGSDLELVVEDSGIGIAPEFLPHMFDSFRQSDSSSTRTHGGLGIGLAIAKHLVTLHGGTLEGGSDGVGRGARFVVRLPVSSLVSSSRGVRRVPAVGNVSTRAAQHGLRGIKALVVDDERDARELVQIVLESCGVEVRLADSVAAALAEVEQFRPDVIISDIGMPNEDGYALIKKVRTEASEALRRTPAIALTAYAMAEDRNRTLLAGFNLHLTKPADPAGLVTMVADLVGRRMTDAPGSG
ncbi:MAG: Chemotaxis protein methyltransferase CheR [Labilithrix sp.]|nr:Chemotaxis protein methyltransferase CheR [Labilithrix sp.]